MTCKSYFMIIEGEIIWSTKKKIKRLQTGTQKRLNRGLGKKP